MVTERLSCEATDEASPELVVDRVVGCHLGEQRPQLGGDGGGIRLRRPGERQQVRPQGRPPLVGRERPDQPVPPGVGWRRKPIPCVRNGLQEPVEGLVLVVLRDRHHTDRLVHETDRDCAAPITARLQELLIDRVEPIGQPGALDERFRRSPGHEGAKELARGTGLPEVRQGRVDHGDPPLELGPVRAERLSGLDPQLLAPDRRRDLPGDPIHGRSPLPIRERSHQWIESIRLLHRIEPEAGVVQERPDRFLVEPHGRILLQLVDPVRERDPRRRPGAWGSSAERGRPAA